ncbi:MAG: sugar phosphate isomerase/epimerase, partial [Bacteroidales bacterium]|nr:sugar phosphate isomerase/epimerase [Bacteroidales bacterium]
QMGPIAAKYGGTVVIEPLRKKESNLINKVSEGMKIVMEINHPNIQVLGDIYHMRCESEPPGSLIEAADHLRHIHIAELANRTAPGVAGDNFYPYLKALKAIHYQGGISIEGRWGKDFPRELIKSRAYLLGQINTLN